MITHFFTLQALNSELDLNLRGKIVEEVYTQRKNELLISFKSKLEEKLHVTLVVNIEPKFNYICLQDRISRARKNSVDLFDEIVGDTVECVTIHPEDRLIVFSLKSGKRLLLRIYNTAVSNILLVDADDAIMEAFKNYKRLNGTIFHVELQRSIKSFLNGSQLFIDIMSQYKNVNVLLALKNTLPIFGTIYCREILYRADINEDLKIEDVTASDLKIIYNHLSILYQQSVNPEPVIYILENNSRLFSVIPLSHIKPINVERFQSVNDGIKNYIKIKYHSVKISSKKNMLLKKVEKELYRLTRSIEKNGEPSSRISIDYEAIGKLLLANLHLVKKGMEKIELHEMRTATMICVDLDPALSPVNNAERYFVKARKAKGAREESVERLKNMNETRRWLSHIKEKLDKCTTEKETRQLIRENEEKLIAMNLIEENSGQDKPPFRIFSVAGGYEVWVGKSSANNDLLTMKYSKPNDLWFHVRGASGSHTVLKTKSGSVVVPKEAIRQAASIAAYYSKMKNAGTVPVAYCERKYVRKQKHSKEGAVFLEREEVIFVKPGLLGNP